MMILSARLFLLNTIVFLGFSSFAEKGKDRHREDEIANFSKDNQTRSVKMFKIVKDVSKHVLNEGLIQQTLNKGGQLQMKNAWVKQQNWRKREENGQKVMEKLQNLNLKGQKQNTQGKKQNIQVKKQSRKGLKPNTSGLKLNRQGLKLNRQCQQSNKQGKQSNKQGKEWNRLLQSSTTSEVEYIKNGDFSINTCKTTFCVYTLVTFRQSYLSNWQPDPEIEIGDASFYIKGSGKFTVAELAANKGTCIKQLIPNMPKGNYTLKYSYGDKVLLPLSKAQVYVYLNNTLIDARQAPDNKWHDVLVENIFIAQDNVSYYFRMCGNLSAGVYGVAVSNVSFRHNVTVKSNGASSGTTTSTNSTSAPTTTNSSSSTSSTNQSNTASNSSTTTSSSSTTTSNSSTATTSNSSLSTNNSSPSNNSNLSSSTNLNSSTSNTPPLSTNNNPPTTNNSTILQNPQTNTSFNQFLYFTLNLKNLNIQPINSNDQYFSSMLDQLMNDPIASLFLKSTIIRKLFTKGFAYLINIDHLWLYIFHNKDKNLKSDIILLKINQFQDSKWNILPKNIENQHLHFPQIQQTLNIKTPQTPLNFYSIQNNSRSFLTNNYKFFIINLPFIILSFIIGKILNKVLKKFYRPSFLQRFKHGHFLIIILLEGNTEQFTYFLLSDILALFSQNLFTKTLNFLSIFFFFTLISLVTALPFLLRYLYQPSKPSEIYDKCSNSFKGSVYFMLDFGLFNVLLGSIHILGQKIYTTQLLLLFLLEFLFNLYTISHLCCKKDFYIDKLAIWINLCGSIIRMILIFTYFLYYSASDDFFQQLDNFQQNLIMLYLFFLLISLSFLSIEILAKFILKIYKTIKKFYEKSQLRITKKQTKKTQNIKRKNHENQNFKSKTRMITETGHNLRTQTKIQLTTETRLQFRTETRLSDRTFAEIEEIPQQIHQKLRSLTKSENPKYKCFVIKKSATNLPMKKSMKNLIIVKKEHYLYNPSKISDKMIRIEAKSETCRFF